MPDLPITAIAATDRNARVLRGINEFGMNLADFFALTTSSRFDAFGNGTGYTVANWISDGVFANVAAVQAVFPIVRAGTDKVDWVGMQTGIDFLIYGALGNGIRGQMKRTLFVPAGQYNFDGHSFEIGYGAQGVAPVGLNGNGYVSITIEGEGEQTDVSGNGMTGTAFVTDDYTRGGFNVTRGQQVHFKNLTVRGPYDNWMANNNPFKNSNGWDVAAFRPPGIANANWIGGAAVNIGIGFSLYSRSESAAAYPARPLPSYFNNGGAIPTSTATTGTVGGTSFVLENVNVQGFICGVGRPHGDSNDEFIAIKGGMVRNTAHAVVIGHSQSRSIEISEACQIEGFHTGLTNVGGLTGNANMVGSFNNIHFGRGYQLINHTQADWSGPVALDHCYAESFKCIGGFRGDKLTLRGGMYSFIEQDATNGIPPWHYDCSYLEIDGAQLNGLRTGLHARTGGDNNNDDILEVNGGARIKAGDQNFPYASHANVAQIRQGLTYMQGLYSSPGKFNRRFTTNWNISTFGRGNRLDGNRTDKITDTYLDQVWTDFHARWPANNYGGPFGSYEMAGSVQRFPVPPLGAFQHSVTPASRSGFFITCPRSQFGDVKADVSDMFAFKVTGVDPTLITTNWFVVTEISGGNMILGQLNNFHSTNGTEYLTNGMYQVTPGTTYETVYICTRIRQNHNLWVGDVTSGSAVISNIRHAFQFGTTDVFTSGEFGMAAGDFFLHHEDRTTAAGGGFKVPNPVISIDYTANSMTLTNNFQITRTGYPLPFFIEVFNA